MRTQVGIIGAGPAGLLLGQVLARAGIESVVIEAQSRAYVESRVRAGLMEHDACQQMRDAGVGERMDREGLVHHGIVLRFGGTSHRIPLTDLAGGRHVTVYGQQEVVKDLIAARLADGLPLFFDAQAHAIGAIDTARPTVGFHHDGADHVLECDIIAGADGFHGISRDAMPADMMRVFERVYPFAWLGILAEAPPVSHELVYASHDRGFALASMRSPKITRLYLQCAPDENLADWPDTRIWDELDTRLAGKLTRGPILQRGITPLRSFVAEPMRAGRLFLLGDAAHIVPPTGAKGLNLAFADVHVLSAALVAFFRTGTTSGLDSYSETALRRVWKAERFSWWMTTLLHRFDAYSPFERRMQQAELDYLTTSRAGMTTIAENYVGLPLL
ncbi:MAG: 4-hydroxybenzoate 3-monooxygenase [Alphaproteobacteria bacterium]|nr:4-hydroxybenzoate 3-monooxygenase [Alphaproteobacteria bacterium]